MAYSVRCADTGADCPGQFTTSTRDELVRHVVLHAEVAHPGLELSQEAVEGLIRKS